MVSKTPRDSPKRGLVKPSAGIRVYDGHKEAVTCNIPYNIGNFYRRGNRGMRVARRQAFAAEMVRLEEHNRRLWLLRQKHSEKHSGPLDDLNLNHNSIEKRCENDGTAEPR